MTKRIPAPASRDPPVRPPFFGPSSVAIHSIWGRRRGTTAFATLTVGQPNRPTCGSCAGSATPRSIGGDTAGLGTGAAQDTGVHHDDWPVRRSERHCSSTGICSSLRLHAGSEFRTGCGVDLCRRPQVFGPRGRRHLACGSLQSLPRENSRLAHRSSAKVLAHSRSGRFMPIGSSRSSQRGNLSALHLLGGRWPRFGRSEPSTCRTSPWVGQTSATPHGVGWIILGIFQCPATVTLSRP